MRNQHILKFIFSFFIIGLAAITFNLYLVHAEENVQYEYIEDIDGLDSESEYAIVYESIEYNFLSKILYHDKDAGKTDQLQIDHTANKIKLNNTSSAFLPEKQLWKVVGNNNDGWAFQSLIDGKYLNIEKNTTISDRIPVTTNEQKLKVEKNSDNSYLISKTIEGVDYYVSHDESAVSHFYLSTNQTKLHFYKRKKKINNQFEQFKTVVYREDNDGVDSNNNYSIVFKNNDFRNGNKILYHAGSSNTSDQVVGTINKDLLNLDTKYNKGTQKWYIRGSKEKGYYIISNDGVSRYLNITSETTPAQRVPISSENQKFNITLNNDGSYYISRDVNGNTYYLNHTNNAAEQFNVSKTPCKIYLYKETEFIPNIADSSFSGVSLNQPFVSADVKSDYFRIPSLITLKNGWIVGGADVRWKTPADSPANLDSIVSVSKDNGLTWNWEVINYFGDYSNEYSDLSSSSFIDTALVEYENQLIMAVDVTPSYVGLASGNKIGNQSTGFDEEGRLIIAKSSANSAAPTDISQYTYRVDLEKKFQTHYIENENKKLFPIIQASDNSETGYFVDSEFNVYETINSSIVPSYVIQSGSGNIVKKNLFYYQSDWKVYPCFFTGIRKGTIENNSIKWDNLKLINVKKDQKESFLGVSPGRGTTLKLDNEKTRILFVVYDSSTGTEKASVIYSDDGGNTWNRGNRTNLLGGTIKSSESQLVVLPDNTLRMYSRNSIGTLGYTDSTDGGQNWSTYKIDSELDYVGNCMSSFINIDGSIITEDKKEYKNLIMASYPKNEERRDGVIRLGYINDQNETIWLNESTVKYAGTYWYSSLTQLKNTEKDNSSTIGLLFEDSNGSIKYDSFDISTLLNNSLSFVVNKSNVKDDETNDKIDTEDKNNPTGTDSKDNDTKKDNSEVTEEKHNMVQKNNIDNNTGINNNVIYTNNKSNKNNNSNEVDENKRENEENYDEIEEKDNEVDTEYINPSINKTKNNFYKIIIITLGSTVVVASLYFIRKKANNE